MKHLTKIISQVAQILERQTFCSEYKCLDGLQKTPANFYFWNSMEKYLNTREKKKPHCFKSIVFGQKALNGWDRLSGGLIPL